MLQELMKKVGEKEMEEKRQGGAYQSSFAPYDPPKSKVKSRRPSASDDIETVSPEAPEVQSPRSTADDGKSKSKSKPDDRLGYLPCHYFDYICGTSTGG